MFESEFERSLFALRQEKLQQIAALGHAAYPNHYRTTHDVPALRALYDGSTSEQLESERPQVSIAGRIMAIRAQGKAGFAQLQQGGQRLQIYVRKRCRRREGIRALQAARPRRPHRRHAAISSARAPASSRCTSTAITFLTKAMLALPEKYHGLEDVELRYRQRYRRSLHQPDVREVFVKRAQVLRAFAASSMNAVISKSKRPMMQSIAGGAMARPFTTHHNALDIHLFLRIAPELYLKRLVVGGLDRVYEINRNFRNEGVSTRHNPEFTMLEFYQAYANYHDLMDLTEELVKFVAHGGQRHADHRVQRHDHRSVAVDSATRCAKPSPLFGQRLQVLLPGSRTFATTQPLCTNW